MEDWELTLRDYWNDQLCRFDLAEVSHVNLDEDAKRILVDLGLPDIAIDSALIFKPLKSLVGFEFYGEKYVVLGNNVGDVTLGIFVGLRNKSAEIYQLHTKYDKLVVFMNSNLKAFLLFLKRYYEFILSVREFSEDEFIANIDAIDRLRDDFLSIDARAIAGGNNYWTLILAELDGYRN